jgi:hypothetical protein
VHAPEAADIREAQKECDLRHRKAALRKKALGDVAPRGLDDLAVAGPMLAQTALNGTSRSVQRASAPSGSKLFVNVHAGELSDPDLFSPWAPLSAIADCVVLEITERASLKHVQGLRSRLSKLASGTELRSTIWAPATRAFPHSTSSSRTS